MQHSADFSGANFDVGTGKNVSLNEIAKLVNEILPDVQFEYVSGRLGDVLETKASTTGLKKLGWKADIGIDKGIRSCFEQLKEKINA